MIILLFGIVHIYAADDQRRLNWQLFTALQDEAPFETIKRLIEDGAQVETIKSYSGSSSALHYAATRSEGEKLALYLVAFDVNVNDTDCSGSTPSHFAATWDNGGVIEILWQKGADVNAENCAQYTPLHFACLNNSINAAKALLQCGADRQHKDKDQKTPLDIAQENDHQNIVQCLSEWQDLPV